MTIHVVIRTLPMQAEDAMNGMDQAFKHFAEFHVVEEEFINVTVS